MTLDKESQEQNAFVSSAGRCDECDRSLDTHETPTFIDFREVRNKL